MSQDERDFIAGQRKGIAMARELFSNEHKGERERMVVRAFLRCAGVPFSEDELISSAQDPPDVVFGSGRFEVTEELGGRKRGDEMRELQRRYDEAEELDNVLEPWRASEAMTFEELAQIVIEALGKKQYEAATHRGLDALVYLNIKGRHLWPAQYALSAEAADEIAQQGWRSVSALAVPYGVVLFANEDSPDFLIRQAGKVLSEWPAEGAFGLFDP